MNPPCRLPRRPLPLLLAGLSLAISAQAQETRLGETTVSASRLDDAASRSVQKPALEAMKPATPDTASLLKDVPGVSLATNGGVSSLPAIHGLADDRLRIQVDGMDLVAACPNHMNPALSYLDPSAVGSVKVFAGITPVSVGGDSLGGSIQVDSPRPEFAAPGQGTLAKGQAGARYRDNGNASGANVALTLAGEALSLSYAGSTAHANAYKAAADFKPASLVSDGRVPLARDVVGSTGYRSENQSLSLALTTGRHLFQFQVAQQHLPYELFPNQRMDMTGNDSTRFNLHYTGELSWGMLEARLYDEKTRHKMDFGEDKQYWYTTYAACLAAGFVPGAACAAGMPMDTEGKTTGAMVKADIALSGQDVLRVGGEFQRYRLSDWWSPSGRGMWPNTFWNIRDGQRDRTDAFAEWQTRWSPRWQGQFGLRSTTVRTDAGNVAGYSSTYDADANAFNALNRGRTDHNLDLTLLARYTPDARASYEFGFAQKTRSPNLYERYTWSTGGMAMVMNNFAGDGNGYLGNPDLKPEVAHTLSATGDWHDGDKEGWALRATPYLTYVDDFIDARRCYTSAASTTCGTANALANKTTGFVYLQYANQSARLYGVDLSGRLPLARATGYGSFALQGVLNYVRGANRNTGDNLYNIMPANARLALVQKLGAWSTTAEWQVVAAKRDVSQVRDEVSTGGYGLLNLRGSYEWRQVRLDLGVDNLLNKFHYLPLGGAYLGEGKTMSGTGVPWGIPVPGMGRSFYTGVNLRF